MDMLLTPERALPSDGTRGTLVGRVWLPGPVSGPAVVAIRGEDVIDLTRHAPTMSDLVEATDPARLAKEADGPRLGGVADLLANSAHDRRDPERPCFLAPNDLQAIKAAGVTFVRSTLERVIEEMARGDLGKAAEIRTRIETAIGAEVRNVVPGSDAAAKLKEQLVQAGLWSQYLEVAIGPDAEIFTKAQPMSAVGTGAEIGLHPRSSWNNPEPEIVLVVSSRGEIRGATLGNDVNLRDFEGRSALLLSKAKDNNGSCSIGPLIRLFDGTFGIDDVRAAEVRLEVAGEDGFVLEGSSSIREISRDPTDLVAQTIGKTHQYPDGFVLYLGTMFAPIKDRLGPGQGFTHKVGDRVAISCETLGTLVNRVNTSDRVAPWDFGVGALMRNLADRGVLGSRPR
jgi:fumarylacetoacetate (FAA) hydrolase family protein